MLPLEILTEVIGSYLAARESVILANLIGSNRSLVNLKLRANLIVAQLHQTTTYSEIFRQYCQRSDYYHVALAAYQAIVKTASAKTFKYPTELITIGLALEDASVVAAGLSSHVLDYRDPIVAEIYTIAVAKPLFRNNLLKHSHDYPKFCQLVAALLPQSRITTCFKHQDVSLLLPQPDPDDSEQEQQYLADSQDQYLRELFLNYQQDWAWPQMVELANSANYLFDSTATESSLASLTARYLSNLADDDRLARATSLVKLNLLHTAMYVVVLLNQGRNQSIQTKSLPWYRDPILVNRINISLSQIIDYAVSPGPQQWQIGDLLSALLDPGLLTQDELKLQLDGPVMTRALFEYVKADSADRSYYDLLVRLAPHCRLTTIVTLANQCHDLDQLRIRLLLVLAERVANLPDTVDQAASSINLMVELADLVVTEEDLAVGLTAPNVKTTWSQDDFLTMMLHLLPWYRAPAGYTRLTDSVSAQLTWLTTYILASVADVVGDGQPANVILYATALRYGFNWPLDQVIGLDPANWTEFVNVNVAAAWLEQNYGLVDLELIPLSSDTMLGGISRELLRLDHNVVEV